MKNKKWRIEYSFDGDVYKEKYNEEVYRQSVEDYIADIESRGASIISRVELIRVLVVRPGKNPQEKWIENTLEAMQQIVGGYIQCVPLYRERSGHQQGNVDLVCNEDGKWRGLPKNRFIRRLNYDVVCGTFFLVNGAEEDFASLDGEQVDLLQEEFSIE